MDKAILPTFLGVAVILVGIVLGGVLVQNSNILKIGSLSSISPNNVRVSNETDTSFTISWTTESKTKGVILWGTNKDLLTKRSESSQEPEWVHLVNIEELNPETTYYFKIQSSGKVYENGTQPWEAKTGTKLGDPSIPSIITGTILDASESPAPNVIVHATINSGSTLTTETTRDGSWTIPLGYSRSKNLNSYIEIDEENTLVEINVFAGPLGAASAKVYPTIAKPAPPIIIGKSHDFRKLKELDDTLIPEADVVAPRQSTSNSGFEIPDSSEIESESE